MSLKSMLIEAGLGTAMEECGIKTGSCQHSENSRRGHRFCYNCGIKLEVQNNCPYCGKAFYSSKAFRFHVLKAMHKLQKCTLCYAELRFVKKHADHWGVYCDHCELRGKYHDGKVEMAGNKYQKAGDVTEDHELTPKKNRSEAILETQ